MRKNIFKRMFLLSLISILLTSVALLTSLYFVVSEQNELELKRIARFFATSFNQSELETPELELATLYPDIRLTHISITGNVLYDSERDVESLENHLDRKEVQDALKYGEGYRNRISQTLRQDTIYYAYRLEDGSILRVSMLVSSIIPIFVNDILIILCVIFLLSIISLVVANTQTKKIVEPVNFIDLEQPLASKTYDEFSPILRRLDKQNKVIEKQIEKLEMKQKEFESITNDMNEGLLLLNNKEEVIFLNASAKKTLGIQTKLGRVKYINYVHTSAIKEVIATSFTGQKAEITLAVYERWYNVSATPILNADKVQGVVVLLLDVTVKLENENMRKQFTANVSHDLRTPLQSISGYAEIMKNGLVETKDMTDFSEKIYHESQRMIKLVNEIIKLSQLDEGIYEGEEETIEIKTLIDSILSTLHNRQLDKQLTVEVHGTNFSVHSNYVLIYELVYNIIDNAIKYNIVGGKLIIEIKDSPEKTITITDTGIGISAEDLPRIFERFYRGEKSRSTTIDGSGLGLSFVKHIAETYDIKTKVTSEQNKGTSFIMTFPENTA